MEAKIRDLFCDLITELDEYSLDLSHDEYEYYPGIDDSMIKKLDTENMISTELYTLLKKYVDRYYNILGGEK